MPVFKATRASRSALRDWSADWGGLLCIAVGALIVPYALVLAFVQDPEFRKIVSDLCYFPVNFVSALLAWRVGRRGHLGSQARRAWGLLAAGFLLMGLGNLIWACEELLLHERPFPSWADVGYLLSYLLLLLGILAFPRGSGRDVERTKFWLDAAVIGIAGTMIIWSLSLRPVAIASYSNWFENVLAVAYPLGDLALLFGITTLLLRKSQEQTDRTVRILAASMVAVFVADILFGFLNVENAYQSGDFLDLVFVIGYYLMGVAAQYQYLYTSRRTRRSVGRLSREERFTWVPYLAVGAAYALLLVVAVLNWSEPLGEIVVGAVALTLLVVARQIVSVRDNISLVSEKAASRSAMLDELVNAQEAERRRLSTDIHDGPLQAMGVSLMALDRALRRLEQGDEDLAVKELRYLRTNLTDTVGDIRAVLADLSLEVLSAYGLVFALRSHFERYSKATEIKVNFEENLAERMPPETELLVYRLIQEALANVRKYSHASNVKLSLLVEGDTLSVELVDDGRGFDRSQMLQSVAHGEKLGILSMIERARLAGGSLKLESEAGQGTVARLTLPLPSGERDAGHGNSPPSKRVEAFLARGA